MRVKLKKGSRVVLLNWSASPQVVSVNGELRQLSCEEKMTINTFDNGRYIPTELSYNSLCILTKEIDPCK